MMGTAIDYDRRTVLKTLGGTVVGSALTATLVSARGNRKPPTDKVDTTKVSIFRSKDDPVEVQAGNWLNHIHGWVDGEGGDKTKEDVERWLDAVEITPSIDGEVIENPDQYWGDVYYSDQRDSWAVFWEYVTPPKPPGLHEFSVEFSYPDGYEDVSDDEDANDLDIPPGYTSTRTGYYRIGRGGR